MHQGSRTVGTENSPPLWSHTIRDYFLFSNGSSTWVSSAQVKPSVGLVRLLLPLPGLTVPRLGRFGWGNRWRIWHGRFSADLGWEHPTAPLVSAQARGHIAARQAGKCSLVVSSRGRKGCGEHLVGLFVGKCASVGSASTTVVGTGLIMHKYCWMNQWTHE